MNEETALHLAVSKKNVEIIKLLMSNKNINVNALNYILSFKELNEILKV